MKLLLQLLFLLFINFSYCQDYREATIFFNDSTSIKGYGEIKNNKIFFKVKQEDKPSVWSFDFAKGLLFSGYGFSEKYEYVKFEKNLKPKIFKVVEEGNVTLYADARVNYRSFTNSINGQLPRSVSTYEYVSEKFYVKREAEEFATDIIFSFKKRAKIYFSDCEKIIEMIENKKFNKNNISDMVFYYNEFCGKEKQEN
jgi:hypothetical protein